MSLEALLWAGRLPLSTCSHTAFRVLMLYADRADQLGYSAWHTEQHLADVLGCSTRTIRRARAELCEVGLMRQGDQRLLEHRRGDRRPVVYDVLTPALQFHEQLRGDILVHPSFSRGDK